MPTNAYRKKADETIDHAHPLGHPSIYSAGGTFYCRRVKRAGDFTLLRCGRADCGSEICSGGMFHCPLCPRGKFAKDIPSRIKDHFKKVHWENRIHEFPGILYLLIFMYVIKMHVHKLRIVINIKMRCLSWLLKISSEQ